nr:MAG TPA: hypothetical protein [Caudoviricetes sp.]
MCGFVRLICGCGCLSCKLYIKSSFLRTCLIESKF